MISIQTAQRMLLNLAVPLEKLLKIKRSSLANIVKSYTQSHSRKTHMINVHKTAVSLF